MGGGTKVIPPFFFSDYQIYMDDSYIFCNYEALFFYISIVFNTILPTLNKTLYTSIVKFPYLALEHVTSGTKKLETNCNNASVDFILIET
jgi:hypothetical protein